MSDNDFLLVQQLFADRNSPYLIQINRQNNRFDPTGWQLDPNILSGMLDYYNSEQSPLLVYL
jgi:hypothetical protein